MNNIYENIRTIRKEKSISQGDMADALDMFQANYGKLERGITELTISRLYKIAEILNVGVEDILGLTNVDSRNNTQGSDIETLKNENEELKKSVSTLQENSNLLKGQILTYKAIVSLMKKDENNLFFALPSLANCIFKTLKSQISELTVAQFNYSKINISTEDKEDLENEMEFLSEEIFDVFNDLENTLSFESAKDEVFSLFSRLIYFNEFLLPEYTHEQIEVLRNEFEKYLSKKKTTENKNENI